MKVKFRILEQSDGRWLCDIRGVLANGEEYRTRRTPKVTSYSAAERWAQKHWSHVLEHGPKPKADDGTPLAQFAERWMEGLRLQRLANSTLRGYKHCLARIREALGDDIPVEKIGREEIDELKQHLAKRSPKTINNTLAALSSMLRWAEELGIIRARPKVGQMSLKRRPPQFYEVAEYEKRVAAASTMAPGVLVVVLLAGDSGLRCGEVLGLQWSDIDFVRDTIVVQHSLDQGTLKSTKSGRFRAVPITARTKAALESLPRHGSYVLAKAKKGEPLTPSIIKQWVRNAELRAGVPKSECRGRLHIFRHTFASHLVWGNVDLYSVGTLLGHQDPSTTQIYAHVNDSARRAAIDRLETVRGKTRAEDSGEAT